MEKAEIMVCVAALSITFWLLSHRYEGIWHDSILYAIVAAHYLYPEAFFRELFFAFGSQGDFSLYPAIFSWLVSSFGLDRASQYVTLTGGLLWCGAFFALGWVVFGAAIPFYFVALAGAVLTLPYSPNFGTFLINENFATARIVAMPLALFGIALDVSGRRVSAVMISLFATSLHPLLGIWGLVTVLFRRWTPSALLVVAILIFGAVFLPPLFFEAPLFQLMDAEWIELVSHTSIDVFLARGSELQVERFFFWISALLLGARFGEGRLRNCYSFVALMVSAGYFLSLLCSYFFPVVWVIQLQLWRGLWLGICLGIVALADVGWRYARRGCVEALLVSGAALLAYMLADNAVFVLVILGVGLALPGLASIRSEALSFLRSRTWLVALIVSGMLLVLLPNLALDMEISGARLSLSSAPSLMVLLGFFVGGGLCLGALLCAAMIEVPALRRVMLVAVVPLFVFALEQWDGRTGRARAQEALYLAEQAHPHPLSAYVANGEVVLWPGNEAEVWFRLKTAHYISWEQVVGMVFSQKKAIEARRRAERLALSSLRDENSIFMAKPELGLEAFRARVQTAGGSANDLRRYTVDSIKAKNISYLCEDPELDWIVAEPPENDQHLIAPPITLFSEGGQLRALYRCSNFRS